MTRTEIFQELRTTRKAMYDIQARLDDIMRTLHNESSVNIEDLNTAVSEMADEIYGGNE